MERYLSKGSDETNKKLTDKMIEDANNFVDSNLVGEKEYANRCCHVWDLDRFTINCTLKSEYKSFIFKIVDNDIKFLKIEGDFRS